MGFRVYGAIRTPDAYQHGKGCTGPIMDYARDRIACRVKHVGCKAEDN